jgi:uncharacterized protein (DUF1786 family)
MSSLTTPEQIRAFREITLLRGLKLEIMTGMKMSGGRTAYAIIKKQYNLKGGKQKVYDQLKADLTERGILQ